MADVFKLVGGVSKFSEPQSTLNSGIKNVGGVTGNLEYVKMLTKDKLTVRIACPDGNIVRSGMSSDFSFTLSNDWGELAPLGQIPIIGDLGQSIASLAMAATDATQGSLEALWMTSATWKGSALPKFSINLVFLNYSQSASFMSNMLSLARGALPIGAYATTNDKGEVTSSYGGDLKPVVDWTVSGITTISNEIANQLQNLSGSMDANSTAYNLTQDLANVFAKNHQFGTAAPNAFGLTTEGKGDTLFRPLPKTTYAIEIGKWFKANNMLIDSVQPNFSKETVQSGNPLLMSCNVVFRPYQKITFDTFQQYFQIKG